MTSAVLRAQTPESSDIPGLVTVWFVNPLGMTPEEFSSAPGLLYHGTHKSFVFDRSYRYDSAHMYASAGGCTLGTGFYLTPDRFVAEHLSRKRREQLSMPWIQSPVVGAFLPYGAKLLDMRDRSEAGENLPFPRELFDRWREYLDKSLATIDPREEAGHRDYIRSLAVLSRAWHPFGIKEVLFHASGQPHLFEAFRNFMADAGIDAVAYDDGPRPYYGVDRLITYVFYRFDRIGDYRTWNPPTFPDATERTDAILARS